MLELGGGKWREEGGGVKNCVTRCQDSIKIATTGGKCPMRRGDRQGEMTLWSPSVGLRDLMF